MIRRTLTALLATATLFLALGAARAADRYTIDPTHTSIIFSVAHSGFSYTYGMFRTASGNYIIDKQNPANSQFQLVIKADSIFTNDTKRDSHLMGADFFNVQQFPEITFQSTKCAVSNTADGVVYQLTGNLTIHGVTRQVNIPLRMLGEGVGPYGDQRSGFLCQIEVKRSDFGMTNLLEKNLVGDAVGITVSFEGTQPQAGAARQ
jgi:polyisoprenoid-binding protein YceI